MNFTLKKVFDFFLSNVHGQIEVLDGVVRAKKNFPHRALH